MRLRRVAAALFAFTLALTPAVFGRVLSYAPYTDRTAIPAQQLRTNRLFVLMEAASSSSALMGGMALDGHVVLYDSMGEFEPAVIFPTNGRKAQIVTSATRENSDGRLSILVWTNSISGDQSPVPALHFSNDSGASWTRLDIPVPLGGTPAQLDTGGPFAASRSPFIRVGNEQAPFVIAMGRDVHSISSQGTKRLLHSAPAGSNAKLEGRDAAGSRFLVVSGLELITVDQNATVTPVGRVAPNAFLEGWITPTGTVYVEERAGNQIRLLLLGGHEPAQILTAGSQTGLLNLFAVPTFDYSGAWIIERGPGRPTILSRHTPSAGLVKQWEDVTAPQVEALHAGSSGEKLLIQVHRPRPGTDQRMFIDPALAVWRAGQQAPRVYDELFMSEESNKGFVHLDVETLEAGAPFVFDAGIRFTGGGGGVSAGGGGGGDVIQEWGVVRSSLKQRLVLPAVGRTEGAFGSFWTTDVILYNPLTTSQNAHLRFVPVGDQVAATAIVSRTLTLAPREIRLLPDALRSLFGFVTGNGALYITPDSSINVTSRTSSRGTTGTFGFGMNAIDTFAAPASPRFPVSFAGAFLGPDYRTNVIVTDASDRGAEVTFTATGTQGPIGRTEVPIRAAPGTAKAVNGLAGLLGVLPYETGALLVRPVRGSAIASVFVTDNRTNDSTYFPPDLPTSSVVRTIPVIGHVDGANNSQFRSDLYLYNPTAQPRSVFLQAKSWDTNDQPQVLSMTLLPNESRVIRDVLRTAFGKTGLARLRFMGAFGDTTGIRITSRTYSVREDGGTFGFLMPPLNNFQSGASGDTLEILGAIADSRYRTNIGLVDLTAFPTGQSATARVEIIGDGGATLDSFSVNFPIAGGMQVNDIFRSRNIDVVGAVLIRIKPLTGLIGAYATWVDNRTNDSVYLAANLGAQD